MLMFSLNKFSELFSAMFKADTNEDIYQNLIEIMFLPEAVLGCGIFRFEREHEFAVLKQYKELDEEFAQKIEYLPLSLNIFEKSAVSQNIIEFTSIGSDELLEGRKVYFVSIGLGNNQKGLIVFTTAIDGELSVDDKFFIEFTASIANEVIHKHEEFQSLITSNDLSRGIVNSAPIGIIFIDQEGVVVFENPAMSAILKTQPQQDSSLIGKKILSISSSGRQQFRKSIEELLAGNSVYGFETEYESMDGNPRQLEFHGATRRGSAGEVIGAVLMCLDLTNYKLIESQLRHAQKMEAIGTLAGGIAHDFNNLLTGIMGNVELAMIKMNSGDDIKENLDNIFMSSKRAADLTSQLLAFGRRRMELPKPLNLLKCVNDAVKVLKRTIDPLINIEIIDKAVLHNIYGDEGQMNQLLMNLLINARDSMPEGGTIEIVSENIVIDDDYYIVNKESLSGHFYRLTIKDTGTGIPEEIMKQIFEPFFTTKKQGKGTGLGLAMVYVIVKGHHGWIEVDSKLGAGTKFIVYLPLTEDQVELKPAEVSISLTGGSETILLTDDESFVRDLGKELLENFGYNVMTAQDGVEALEIYRQNRDKIDLLILDLSMPKKSGRETLRELLEFDSEVKVIVSSGFDKTGPVKSLLDMGAKTFVQKPYRLDKMLTEVRKVLDGD